MLPGYGGGDVLSTRKMEARPCLHATTRALWWPQKPDAGPALPGRKEELWCMFSPRAWQAEAPPVQLSSITFTGGNLVMQAEEATFAQTFPKLWVQTTVEADVITTKEDRVVVVEDRRNALFPFTHQQNQRDLH